MYDYPCDFCDGRVGERLLDNEMLRVPTLGYVILEQVPVGVCDRCGMRYYDCSVVKRAEDVFRSGGTATRPVPVAPYRLSSA